MSGPTQVSDRSLENLKPWKKGQSGNPGGQPRIVKELLALARSEVAASIALAVRLRDDEDEDSRVRLEAAKFITSYGLGKPRDLTLDEDDAAGAGDHLGALSDDEIRALARAKLSSEH